MKLGFSDFSSRIRQRARRLAWRGRSCKRCLKGLEPADDAGGIDHAVSGLGPGGSLCRPDRRPDGYKLAIGIEKVDAGDSPLEILLRRGSTMRGCGSKSWKEGT